MRASTTWLPAALAATALAAGGCGGRVAAQEPARPAAKQAAAQTPAPPAEPRRTLADYDVITVRNPFSSAPVRKPVKPKPKPTPVKPATPAKPPEREVVDNLSLTAIFVPTTEGEAPSVLIEEEGAKPRTLKAGDTLLKGTITEIALDRIVVTIDAKPRTILVGESFSDGTKTRIKGSGGSGGSGWSGTSSSKPSGGSSSKPSGGKSSLLTDEERKLPLAERTKLMMKRMKERRAKERADKE